MCIFQFSSEERFQDDEPKEPQRRNLNTAETTGPSLVCPIEKSLKHTVSKLCRC